MGAKNVNEQKNKQISIQKKTLKWEQYNSVFSFSYGQNIYFL